MWHTPPVRHRILRALLTATEPLTARDVGLLLGSHQRNAKKELDGLVEAGLLTGLADPRRRSTGRVPKAFHLSPEQRRLADIALKTPPAKTRRRSPRSPQSETSKQRPTLSNGTPAQLRRGNEIVVAHAAANRFADLISVLASAQATVQPRWAALCGDEVIFVFDGPQPVPAAADLLMLLDHADLPVRRATVSYVGSAASLLRSNDPHRQVRGLLQPPNS